MRRAYLCGAIFQLNLRPPSTLHNPCRGLLERLPSLPRGEQMERVRLGAEGIDKGSPQSLNFDIGVETVMLPIGLPMGNGKADLGRFIRHLLIGKMKQP